MKTTIHRSVHPAAAVLSFARRTAVTLLTAAALLLADAPAARALVSFPRTYWDPGPDQTGTALGSGGSGVWDTTTANWVSTSGSGDVPFQTLRACKPISKARRARSA